MADVVPIIAGRFERNPPLYYEIRLKRSAERIAANPDDLDAYDDAGVACDRLGRGDEAIAWITLAQALVRDGERSSVARLAFLRAEELVAAGRRSLDPAVPTDPESLRYQLEGGSVAPGTMGPRDKAEIKAAFARLRAEADAWHRARLAFMLPRLEAGRHPDTDPTFWQGYVEKPPASIPAVLASVRTARSGWSSRTAIGWSTAIAVGVALVATLALPAFLLRLARKDRRKPAARPSEL